MNTFLSCVNFIILTIVLDCLLVALNVKLLDNRIIPFSSVFDSNNAACHCSGCVPFCCNNQAQTQHYDIIIFLFVRYLCIHYNISCGRIELSSSCVMFRYTYVLLQIEMQPITAISVILRKIVNVWI